MSVQQSSVEEPATNDPTIFFLSELSIPHVPKNNDTISNFHTVLHKRITIFLQWPLCCLCH